jgi:hypothetical protein
MYETNFFTELLLQNKPFIFTKFGDGEYCALTQNYGHNCDGEIYSKILQDNLLIALKYLSSQTNCYMGKWHNFSMADHMQTLTSEKIKWVNYHTILLDQYNIKDRDLFNFFKVVKESKKEKIFACNHLLNKAIILLNLDKCINIPLHGWFVDHYDIIKNDVISNIKTEDPIILLAGGMGAKVLIADLHQLYPKATFIDIGSCLDFILTKKDSRGWSQFYFYDEVYNYFKEILPENWDDEKFNWIYEEAKKEIGRHV